MAKACGVGEEIEIFGAKVAATIQCREAVLQLVGGSERDADVSGQLTVGIQAAAFGDVEMNRLGGPDELTGRPVRSNPPSRVAIASTRSETEMASFQTSSFL